LEIKNYCCINWTGFVSHEMMTVGKREEKVCGVFHTAISVSICFAGGEKTL